MVYSFLTGILGMVVIIAVWVGVQHLVRRHSHDAAPDCDMLDHVFHNCSECSESETCNLRHDH